MDFSKDLSSLAFIKSDLSSLAFIKSDREEINSFP